MKHLFRNFQQKIVILALVASILLPNVASAQLVVAEPVQEGISLSEKIARILGAVLKNAAIVGVVNVGQQIARDAAESVATWIVDGGPGKTPLSYMKSPGDYVKEAGSQALGDFVGSLSQGLGFGNFLCSPSVGAIGIPTGLLVTLNGDSNNQGFQVQPRCNFNDIVDNYESLANSLKPSQMLAQFNTIFEGGQNEVDTLVSSQLQAIAAITAQKENAQIQRLSQPSFKDLTSPISGGVLNPSQLNAEEARALTATHQQDQQNQLMSGLLASGAEAIPAIFASTLLNSLSSKILNRLHQGKGILPESPASGFNLANLFGAGKNTSAGAGQGAVFASVKTAVVSGGDWDLLTLFSACPENYTQSDNCVIDSGFESAIRAAQHGNPITVGEAIQKGMLHGDWQLVPPTDTAQNEDRLCYKSSYCYSNLTKLRKARVIPVGWEIAAALGSGGQRATLGDIVSHFNDCSYTCSNNSAKTCTTDSECGSGGTCGGDAQRDANHPYCHLIDPNWVLKLSETICKAKVYGPVPENSQTPARQQECVDQVSCLQENSDGTCTGAYGYCLREKNTWRFDAEACPAQFAGCRTYSNAQFGELSVVEPTIDSSSCNEKNTGCLGYYTDYDKSGSFNTNAPKIYLNDKAATCDASYAGCSQVINSNSGQKQFLKVAPPGLNCEGEPNDPPECKNYAQSCTVDEVGCELYQPSNGDAAVPGIATFATRDTSGAVVDWGDECSAQCVGYASYYQAPTQLEPVVAQPVAFIPKTAKQCTKEAVGCDQYTNIDTTQKGGGKIAFYSEVQRCARPDDQPHKVFYSWEGSDKTGYQLRQHDLVVDAAGAQDPVYDVPAAQKPALVAGCTADIFKNRLQADGTPSPTFNPDCRELFDEKGTPHYRFISKTLTSSAECTSFRKANVDAANCTAGGGTPNSGSCDYFFLPSGSQICKQEEVGCRAYNGAGAANTKPVFSEQFTSANTWSAGALSSEGITVGDSVFKVSGASTDHTIALTSSKVYNISFWAKGQGSVSVVLKDAGTDVVVNAQPLTLGPEWRRYEISSPVVPSDDNAGSLIFKKTDSNQALYIDNITVKEQTDVVYALRDSWQTPLVCDPNPNDSIPGPALNCQEYKPQSSTTKKKAYLTGFTSLCREQAAGCQKYVNTFNSAEITAKDVPINQKGDKTKTIPADDFVYVVATQNMFCPADKKGCSALGLQNGTKIDTVYRINDPDNYETTSCRQEEEWCQTFTSSGGQQRYFKYPSTDKQCEYRDQVKKSGGVFTGWFKVGTDEPCYPDLVQGGNTYGILRNGDKNYNGNVALCQKEYNACTLFVDHADRSKQYPAGKEYYLMKDKKLDTTSCNGKVSLKDGCVPLEDTSDTSKSIATLATLCKSDPTIDQFCSTILKNLGVPGDAQGKGGVLVDPVTAGPYTSVLPNGGVDCKAAENNGLYVATSCEDKLKKLKEVATNLKDFPTDLGSYDCSNPAYNDVLDIAIRLGVRDQCAKFADANTVVKVDRDRVCSEWLSCKSSVSVWDKSTQKYKQVCTDLGVCNQYSTSGDSVGNCANWVKPSATLQTPLSTAEYVRRNTGWYGNEYSGLSLWNKFQADRAAFFTPKGSSKPVLGVAFDSGCKGTSSKDDGKSCVADEFLNSKTAALMKASYGDDVDLSGACYQQKCWYAYDQFAHTKENKTYTELTCRGYPEEDSPFKTSVVEGFNAVFEPDQFAKGFQSVNVCQKWAAATETPGPKDFISSFEKFKNPGFGIGVTGNGAQQCDCSYKRVSYGGGVTKDRFFSIDVKNLQGSGTCDGGWLVPNEDGSTPKTAQSAAVSKVGLTCHSDLDCIDERIVALKQPITVPDPNDPTKTITRSETFGNQDGTCQFPKTVTNVIGWQGYCLENDLRTHINNGSNDFACLNWLPIDAAGGFDLYNQYLSAGYQPKDGAGALYCTQAKGNIQPDGTNVVALSDKAVDGLSGVYQSFGIYNEGTCDIKDTQKSLYFNSSNGSDWSNPNPINNYCEIGEGISPDDGYYSGAKETAIPAPLKGITADQIDYIEVVFKPGDNQFFPDGYTARIVDDGKVRFFVANDEGKSGKACPTQYALSGVYDQLDPTFSVGNVKNGSLLSKLSYEARCPRPQTPPKKGQLQSIQLPAGCNAQDNSSYFTPDKADKVKDYFECYPGGYTQVKASNIYPSGTPMAVTGVTRTAYAFANKDEVLQGDATDISAGNLSQVWYMRVDNHNSDNIASSAPTGDKFLRYGLMSNSVTTADGILVGNIFNGLCNQGSEHSQTGYELRFNFVGSNSYLSSIQNVGCRADTSVSSYQHLPMQVHVHLKNLCTEIAGVTSDVTLSLSDSKAYTNNVWTPPKSGFIKDGGSKVIVPKAGGQQVITTSTPNAPYGSYSVLVAPTNAEGYWLADTAGVTLLGKSSYYSLNSGVSPVFSDSVIEASAYGCASGLCIQTDPKKPAEGGVDAKTARATILNNLFAKIYYIYGSGPVSGVSGSPMFPQNGSPYTGYDLSKNAAFDVSGNADAISHYPVLYAFDPNNCIQSGSCQLTRRMGMVINGQSKDGAALVGKNSYVANLQFYGWADQDHMPLRKVTVNWGDANYAFASSDAKYRNHKPVCSTAEVPARVCMSGSGALDMNTTCSTDTDCANDPGFNTCQPTGSTANPLRWSFGNWSGTGGDEGACEQRFFQYTHVYNYSDTCDNRVTADYDFIQKYGLQNRVGIGEHVCIYKPKVQLQDNWNVCNGVDSNGNPKGYGGVSKFNVGDSSNACDDATDTSVYTPFAGLIFVKE